MATQISAAVQVAFQKELEKKGLKLRKDSEYTEEERKVFRNL